MSTATIAPADQTAAKEQWIDQMIDLAVDAYYDYASNGVVDDETLAVIGNAMHNIRVRDTLLWEIVNSSPDLDAVSAVLFATEGIVHSDYMAPILTLSGICSVLQGNYQGALLCAKMALFIEPRYSLAILLHVSLNNAGFEETREFFLTLPLTRDECRTGKR